MQLLVPDESDRVAAADCQRAAGADNAAAGEEALTGRRCETVDRD